MTKHRKIGGVTYGIYQKVFDWEAFWGWVFGILILLVLLSSCSA